MMGASPCHVDAESRGGEMGELGLTQPVDRRNDQADPGCRDLDMVLAGVFDRDGIHVRLLGAYGAI